MGSLHTEASPSRRHHSRSEGLQCPVPHPAPLHSPDTGICVSDVTVRRRGGFISCVSQSLTCPSAALQVKAQPLSIRQFRSRASLLLLVARQNLFCPSVADYPWQHTPCTRQALDITSPTASGQGELSSPAGSALPAGRLLSRPPEHPPICRGSLRLRG